jgi:hypothetical protein
VKTAHCPAFWIGHREGLSHAEGGRVEKSGLIVAHMALTPAQRRQRREDNKAMKLSRQMHRRRKPHGRN